MVPMGFQHIFLNVFFDSFGAIFGSLDDPSPWPFFFSKVSGPLPLGEPQGKGKKKKFVKKKNLNFLLCRQFSEKDSGQIFFWPKSDFMGNFGDLT